MNDQKRQLIRFQNFLETLSSGKIVDKEAEKVKNFIVECWDELYGSGDTSMNIMKLHRIENITYTSPKRIEFDIERHGGTVMGSIYAEVYHWTINLEDCTANWEYPKKRLIATRDKPLKVEPIAEKIAKDIFEYNTKSENIEWNSDTQVRVLISKVIPETNKQLPLAENVLEKRLKNYCSLIGGKLPQDLISMKNVNN